MSCNENRLLVLWKSEVPCDEARVELLKDEGNMCDSTLFLLESTKKNKSTECKIFILVNDHSTFII